MKEWCRLEAFLEAIDRKLRSPVLLSFVIGGTNLGSQLIKIQFQKSRRCYVPRRNMRKPLLSKELSMKAVSIKVSLSFTTVPPLIGYIFESFIVGTSISKVLFSIDVIDYSCKMLSSPVRLFHKNAACSAQQR